MGDRDGALYIYSCNGHLHANPAVPGAGGEGGGAGGGEAGEPAAPDAVVKKAHGPKSVTGIFPLHDDTQRVCTIGRDGYYQMFEATVTRRAG